MRNIKQLQAIVFNRSRVLQGVARGACFGRLLCQKCAKFRRLIRRLDLREHGPLHVVGQVHQQQDLDGQPMRFIRPVYVRDVVVIHAGIVPRPVAGVAAIRAQVA